MENKIIPLVFVSKVYEWFAHQIQALLKLALKFLMEGGIHIMEETQ